MKKRLLVIITIFFLNAFFSVQASTDLFDAKKSRTELKIMKGIFNTTVWQAINETESDLYPSNASDTGAYYLAGQGAVFIINPEEFQRYTSLNRTESRSYYFDSRINAKLEANLRNLEKQSKDLAKRLKGVAKVLTEKGIGQGQGSGAGSGIGSGIGGGIEGGIEPGAENKSQDEFYLTDKAVSPKQAEELGKQWEKNRETVIKQVEELQDQLKKNRESAEAVRQKFIERLKNIRSSLIETLATYGDSLTTVKPNEYINLILKTEIRESDSSLLGATKEQHDIISAQKSWITDYKAGRLSLEGFKQKVLQYSE